MEIEKERKGKYREGRWDYGGVITMTLLNELFSYLFVTH